MRNTILKNYAKKILKSEAFVSVIIVFVLALGIIGSSYALYMDIDTNTDYQLVEVGDLAIGFNNGSDTITLDNMTPTTNDIAITQSDNLTSFYIYNEGTYTANYKIKLIPTSNNGVETKYINYQICRDNTDNCKDINTLNESGETIIYNDELSPNSTALDTNNTNPSAYYFVRLWINDQYTDISNTKTIEMKISIEANNASGYLDNDNTLAGAILNNPNITINNSVPDFTGIADYKITGDSTSGEPGLYKAEDDYGISYYFRGVQNYNYVNFAGFTWRIVRINGDGSIRLILDGTLDKVKKDNVAVYQNEKLLALDSDGLVPFNTLSDDNAYVGYMYGDFETNSTSYDDAHENIKDSTIKTYIDTFYEEYLLDYESYLADTLFCGDKSRANSEIGIDNTTLGYGRKKTYYAGTERLHFETADTNITKATPTLECAKGEQNTYSRYTIDKKNTSKGVETNGDLKYPIALLSADELVMAGAFTINYNRGYYLYDSYSKNLLQRIWWTMSPNTGLYSNVRFFCTDATYHSLYICSIQNNYGVRPVINLKPEVLVAGGDGTKDTTVGKGPYTVKLY